ncbi:ANTAR domain-containing protein [Cellulomonas endometrii]|uniref:ANTAR domain-containing protein n=1 Tax=Cellulomonas endometrii TaxID=3036301 RepID=UPI0024ADD0EE|nr:ANTAR domain-containing protein [Cellulomonas endometrii]
MTLLELLSVSAATPLGNGPAWQLCEAARRVLGAGGLSLSLVAPADRPRPVVATTDAVAAALEDAEALLGCGPGHVASTGRRVLVTPATATPPWSSAALEFAHIRDLPWVRAEPLVGHDTPFGTVLIHAPCPEPVEAAERVKDVVGCLALALRTRPSAAWLEPSFASVCSTNQAIGILMARYKTDAATALAVLRAYAFRTGVRLRHAAEAVIGSADTNAA